MCDYSLHNVKTRPAQVGDKLTTRLFGLEYGRFRCIGRQKRSGLPITRNRVVLCGRGQESTILAVVCDDNPSQDCDLPKD